MFVQTAYQATLGRGLLAARRGPAVLSTTRLLSSLAVVEQRNGELTTGSLSAVTAARKLGGGVTVFVAGTAAKQAAEQVGSLAGAVDKVIYVNNELYEKGLADTYAPLLAENIKKNGFTHVLAAHSAFGRNVLPRTAALLDRQQISDVTGIEAENRFVRPIYAGNAILTVESDEPVKLLTVRGTAFPVPKGEPAGSPELVEGADPKVEAQSKWLSEELTPSSDRPDLGAATRVVSGGRGLRSKEEFERVVTPLADALGAAIGASRAAVDSGFADNSVQVGQTGKNVAPELYVAVGISGAIQHLAGMKDSKVIAAINKDADAPIFQVADVGLVGDLFEIVPQLTEEIKKSR